MSALLRRAAWILRQHSWQRSQRATGSTSSTPAALAALAKCGRGGRWQGALELLGTLERAPDAVPLVAWHAALRACRKARRGQEALSVLQRMGGVADLPAHNEALHACRLQHDFDSASVVWRAVRGPDAESYHHMLQLCGATGRWQTALDLLDEMDAAACTIEARHAAGALQACARAREWERAAAVVRRTPRAALDRELCALGLEVSVNAADPALAKLLLASLGAGAQQGHF
eukprot:1755817-Prymnesium_polylepis.1